MVSLLLIARYHLAQISPSWRCFPCMTLSHLRTHIKYADSDRMIWKSWVGPWQVFLFCRRGLFLLYLFVQVFRPLAVFPQRWLLCPLIVFHMRVVTLSVCCVPLRGSYSVCGVLGFHQTHHLGFFVFFLFFFFVRPHGVWVIPRSLGVDVCDVPYLTFHFMLCWLLLS